MEYQVKAKNKHVNPFKKTFVVHKQLSSWVLFLIADTYTEKDFWIVSAQSANKQNEIKMQCKTRDNQIIIEHSIRFSIFRCRLYIAHRTPTFDIAHRPNASTMALANHFFLSLCECTSLFIYFWIFISLWTLMGAIFAVLWFRNLGLWFCIAHTFTYIE